MGDKLLSELSPDEGGSNVPLSSYSDVFEEHFPYYLAIGMTPELYWHGDSTLVKAYREADRIKIERMNYEKWLQGSYIYEALYAMSPMLNAMSKRSKPFPYPEKPYKLATSKKDSEQEQEKKKFDEDRQKWDKMMKAVNARFARKAKEGEKNG